MPAVLPATDEAVSRAARVLRGGGVVAFPTETVYGLGADTFNDRALERVYRLKGRPERNPLIAHVRGEDDARRVTARWDDRCAHLAAHFWPGPLTIVVTRAPRVPPRATAGWPTIAVRAPDHPLAQRLLCAFGGPVSAPSANRFGHVSPTTARHVADDFADSPELLVLDGGPCRLGIESTVVDLCGTTPRLLRPGAISAQELREALGEPVATGAVDRQAQSPGTSPRHYAPSLPAELVAGGDILRRLADLAGPAIVLALGEATVPEPHRVIAMPPGAAAYAARLYGALREAEASGAQRILIEEPTSEQGMWAAIRDRLRRATQR
jgi:L-threonylcarbamoyladenylate synthase